MLSDSLLTVPLTVTLPSLSDSIRARPCARVRMRAGVYVYVRLRAPAYARTYTRNMQVERWTALCYCIVKIRGGWRPYVVLNEIRYRYEVAITYFI